MAQVVQAIALRSGPAGAPIVNEKLAGAAGIVPGMLVEETSDTVVVHGTAAGSAQKLFALTDLPVSGDIDKAYADAVTVRYGAFHSGQEVNALVGITAAIVEGDALESAGDGTLRKVVTSADTADTSRNSVVGYAMVDVDNSGGSGNVRIKIRVA